MKDIATHLVAKMSEEEVSRLLTESGVEVETKDGWQKIADLDPKKVKASDLKNHRFGSTGASVDAKGRPLSSVSPDPVIQHPVQRAPEAGVRLTGAGQRAQQEIGKPETRTEETTGKSTGVAERAAPATSAAK